MAKPRYEPPTVFDRNADLSPFVSYDFMGGTVTCPGSLRGREFGAPKRADLIQAVVNERLNGLAALTFIQTQWVRHNIISSIAYPFGHSRDIGKKDCGGDEEELVSRLVLMACRGGILYKGQWFVAGSVRSPHGEDTKEPLNMAAENLVMKYRDVCERILAPFREFLQNRANGGM